MDKEQHLPETVCSYCRNTIDQIDESVVTCPECKTARHANCQEIDSDCSSCGSTVSTRAKPVWITLLIVLFAVVTIIRTGGFAARELDSWSETIKTVFIAVAVLSVAYGIYTVFGKFSPKNRNSK